MTINSVKNVKTLRSLSKECVNFNVILRAVTSVNLNLRVNHVIQKDIIKCGTNVLHVLMIANNVTIKVVSYVKKII